MHERFQLEGITCELPGDVPVDLVFPNEGRAQGLLVGSGEGIDEPVAALLTQAGFFPPTSRVLACMREAGGLTAPLLAATSRIVADAVLQDRHEPEPTPFLESLAAPPMSATSCPGVARGELGPTAAAYLGSHEGSLEDAHR